MKTALIVGNGFTLSLLAHIGSDLNSSSPFSWDIPNPESEGLLLDSLPHLKKFLSGRMKNEPDFEIFNRLVVSVNKNTTNVISDSDSIDNIILDSGHYLAIAYSWFQTELDRFSFADWEWSKWLSNNRLDIAACLSWNYDLVLERVIECTMTPFYYDVERMRGNSGAPNFYPVDFNRRAIGVYKPHGSCNFSPAIELRWGDKPGEIDHHLKYPRRGLATGYNGPLKILTATELLSARDVADLVLPGERNRFSEEVNSGCNVAEARLVETTWSHRQIDRFRSASIGVERLIIVGFSMMEVDKAEFVDAISGFHMLEELVVVDPWPSSKLMNFVETLNVRVTTLGSISDL